MLGLVGHEVAVMAITAGRQPQTVRGRARLCQQSSVAVNVPWAAVCGPSVSASNKGGFEGAVVGMGAALPLTTCCVEPDLC